MSIITLDDYKAYAGINSAASDQKLQPVVDFANNYIQQYCNVAFTPTTVTEEKQTCSDGYSIILDHGYVNSIQEIRLNGTALDAAYYYIQNADGGIIEFEPTITIPETRNYIEVDYTHGLSSAPDSIKLSALEFVTHIHKRVFKQSASIGGESASFARVENIPAHIKLALNMYKQW